MLKGDCELLEKPCRSRGFSRLFPSASRPDYQVFYKTSSQAERRLGEAEARKQPLPTTRRKPHNHGRMQDSPSLIVLYPLPTPFPGLTTTSSDSTTPPALRSPSSASSAAQLSSSAPQKRILRGSELVERFLHVAGMRRGRERGRRRRGVRIMLPRVYFSLRFWTGCKERRPG